MSVNRAILVGNLGKDPELKYTPAGVAVCNFSIATTEKYKDRDGQQVEKTEWHNIQTWRGLAEVCGKWLTKGMMVYIEGKITTRSYDDRDGNKKYITEIVANDMQMLSRKSENSGGQQQSQEGTQSHSQSGTEGDQQSQSIAQQAQSTFNDGNGGGLPDDEQIPF